MTRLTRLVPLFMAAAAWGQTPAAPPTQPANQSDNAVTHEKSKTRQNGTSKDRLFYALPNFLTLENAGNLPPLTAGQKFKVTAQGSFDPVEFAFYGALAGIGQAENSEPSFGQGAAGYAKRYALRFADGTIENFLAQAVFPSILHQDPRYFQLGKGAVLTRVLYALKRVIVTRSDSGHNQFNASELFGSGIAAVISTYSYHPDSERNFGNLATVWGTQVGLDALGYEIKEFWPDLRRVLHKPKNTAQRRQ